MQIKVYWNSYYQTEGKRANGENVERREFWLVGLQISTAITGSSRSAPKTKLKDKHYMILQPRFWLYSQRKQKYVLKSYAQVHIHSNTLHNSQDTETTQVSLNRGADF